MHTFLFQNKMQTTYTYSAHEKKRTKLLEKICYLRRVWVSAEGIFLGVGGAEDVVAQQLQRHDQQHLPALQLWVVVY